MPPNTSDDGIVFEGDQPIPTSASVGITQAENKMAEWLIRKKIVSSKAAADRLLLVVVLVSFLLSTFLWLWSNFGGSSPTPTPEELAKAQNVPGNPNVAPSSAPRGFTLIELLVVVAIIALLASIILASLSVARSRSRDATRIADMREIETALELFYNDHGYYPVSTSCGATIPNGGWCNSAQSYSNGHWIRDSGNVSAMGTYISSDPRDPSQAASAVWTPVKGGSYFYWSDGQSYMLVYGLENGTGASQSETIDTCTAGNYNYNSNDGIITAGVSCG